MEPPVFTIAGYTSLAARWLRRLYRADFGRAATSDLTFGRLTELLSELWGRRG
jgi:hypothetical protein